MRQRLRGRFAVVAALAVVSIAMAPTASPADEKLVPVSCKVHPRHGLNPGCVPAATSEVRDPGTTLPNIVPDVQDSFIFPELVWDPESSSWVAGTPMLHFDTRAQNLGTVPLQLTVEGVTNPESAAVSQCVSWTARICREQRPVGGFTWHDEHAHFHYEEFATYEVRRLAPDGSPDYSAAGLIDASEKVSFCLVDSQAVREDASPIAPYRACTPTVQGVSPGWTDIYDAWLPGQQLYLEGVSDGRYALVVRLDYANRLSETNDDDNVLEATIEISAGVTQVAIVDRRYP